MKSQNNKEYNNKINKLAYFLGISLGIFIVSLPIICIIVLALSININTTPSNETKTGYILKISTEGLFFKTNEVSLIQGGFVNGIGGNGNISQVTIPNNLLKETQKLFDSHTEVFIDYNCPFFSWSANTTSGCMVNKIYTNK